MTRLDAAYISVDISDVSVTLTDDDTADITVTQTDGSTATTEAGGTDTINVVLDTKPSSNVTIAVSSSDISEGTVDKSSLVFTAANWNTPQTVTVTGEDDNLVDGDLSYNIVLAAAVSSDRNYNGKDPADVTVTNTDDDAGVTLSPTRVTVTEASGSSNTATYTVVLDAQPSSNVTVTPTSGDTDVATVSPASLTFTTTNWNTAQQVTVTGVDDSTSANRSTTITHTASGGGYDSVVIADVSVNLTDDDNSAPTGSVTITGTVTQGLTLIANTSGISDPDGPASLTFSYQWKRDATAISGANQASYTLTQADVGSAISVTVSWTDDGGTAETLTSAATASVTNANDPPTGSVTITGTVTQGLTLTADTSGISDPDGPSSLTFTYQWKRDATDISSATGSTYTLTQADVGSAISVTVSWTDDGGTAETLTSTATASVTNANDPPTGSVTITGTPTQGRTLTAVTSTISDPDGPSSLTFSYQWKRDGTDISGATSNTYVLKQADVGSAITVVVSWTDGGGAAESLTSTATANVANLNDSPTGAVTITGTVTQGRTLTADTSGISDPDGPSNLVFSYQWKRGGTDISGATSSTYVLKQADVGSAITVVVSWTDGGGTVETLTSTATASVTNANNSPTGAVTITGTATQGRTLTADTSTIVDPDGPSSLTFSYQWKRGGTDISGATSSTYVLKQADVGSAITVVVSWTDAGGASESLTSAATASVANVNDSPTGAVTITGTATQGQTLTADTSGISDPDGPSNLVFSYQWKRGGTDISGATSSTYTLKQADVGAKITVTVSWTDGGGIVETLTSAATSVAGVTVSKSSVTVTEASAGRSTTYTVVLDTRPSGNVTVTPNSGDSGVATVSPASLTFTTTNWNTAQAITVTGVDDSSVGDRSTTITHAASGGGYNSVSVPSVSVTLTDNDNSAPTGAVTITGTVTQGLTLTANTSGISDPDGPASLTFTYQWKRDGTAISGANQASYTLTQADVGSAISVTVSWTDDGGTAETLTSATTANVANINDPPTGAVTITGMVTQGQTLTADTSGVSDPDGPSSLTFTYQWKRDATDISSATSRTYILTQADVGAAISVTVSWTDAGSAAETLTSTATASVTNANDPPTGAVTITGTPTQGQTLTAVTSTISDPDGPSNLVFSYQWKRGGTDISGATSNTYVLTQADVGSAITVVVSWTDGGGTAESLTSVATASVTNANDPPTGAVTITGTATQGQTLTADTSGVSDPDGPSNLVFSYQWKRGGSAISGATSSTYVLTQADVGSAITVLVSWTDAGGASESLTSTATAKVINISGADSGTIIDVVEDGGRSIITATVDKTDVKLTLPSGHRVTRVTFSKQPRAAVPAPPSGVNFGGKPSYVDIDLDVELLSSRAIVCLEEPKELSGNLSVYHLADVEGAVWTKLSSPASAPSGYVCGETSSFSTFVAASQKPTFGSESVGDYVWTVGVEVVDVVLPEATGDGAITYSLSPSLLPLDLGLEFNKDSRRAITGTPTKALAKKEFTYKATDEDGDTSALSFSITIRAAEEKERARVLSVVLASFGRTAATGAVDVIGERFVSSSSLAGSPKLTLGGVSMTSFDTRSVAGAVDGVLGLSGGSDIELLEGLDREPVELRRISGRDLFAQSEFSIPLSSSGDDMGGVMRGWTLWGSGVGSGFSGSNLDGDIDTEGELYTGYMGLDYRFGNRGLAGVAISRSVGEVDYEVDGSFHLVSGETGSIRGEVDLELTSVLPYAHYSIRPGLSMWGLFGAGIGDIELEDGAGEVEADVNMLMVALGVRQELARWGDIDFGLKSDGFAVQLKTEGEEGLSSVSGVARRLRLGLEMSRDVYVTGDSLLLPSVEIGGRWDGGDADSGVGMEIGGGIEYVHRGLGLSVEARGRYLLFHEESEFEDWGGSFSLRMGDGVRGRGLWLMFEPEWGEVASGVERMWRGEVDSGVGERGLSSGRVKFDVGYGMETRGSGWLVTPYSGVSIMGEGEREYRLGGKVGVGEWMDISLEGERREVSSGVVDHGILLWWKLLL